MLRTTGRDTPAAIISTSNLGTVSNNQPAFFEMCFAALGNSDYQVVLSGDGQLDPNAFTTIPDNFVVV